MTGCGDDPPAGTGATGGTGGRGGTGGIGEGGGGGQGGQGGGAECTDASTCPDPKSECEVATCDAGVCGFMAVAAGTMVAMQTDGDCQRSVCDGNGAVMVEDDDLDTPDDGLDCTIDACDMGSPTNTPVAAGDACDDGGGDVCNAAGQCVVTSCGDTITSGSEACDDGNTTDCDGCRGDCTAAETGCGDTFSCGVEACDDGNAVEGDGCDSNCTVSGCGNGIKAGNEACDDGNAVEGDGCDSNCTVTGCGNGIKTGNEACDDGNAVEGDGCDSNCTASACGNGIKAGNEACDDGNATSGDGCDANCTVTACGNGIKTGSEACDDGNATNGDGCDINCTATGCGNGIATMGEACDDGNATSGDGCDTNCTVTSCGNGIKAGNEACDDGNTVNCDGCRANCAAVETGCGDSFMCGAEACDDGNAINGDGCDANCTATACGNGIKTANEACDDGNTANCDGCRGNCAAVETGCGDTFLCGAEACDDGNATSGDGCDANCTATACGNGVTTMGETCDDGNATSGDGCDANCTPTGCGNGIVTAAESCDDADTTGADGCSATCQVEAGFTCTGAPSTCTLTNELNCSDGADDDGDSMIDCADSDCALGCSPSFGACVPGQTLYVFNAIGLPKPVGAASAVSSILVSGVGPIARASVQVSITHAWNEDLDISLAAPGGANLDLSSDNGGSDDNYTNTIFNDTCAMPITDGISPFTGCFKPEANFSQLIGSPLQGTWTLTAADDYPAADSGSLTAWSLAVCAAPATCGNGATDPGEQCDDGNSINTDACLSSCQTPSCGDGFLQPLAGEACDDGGTASGDCCSPSCQTDPSCGYDTEPNSVCGQENGPIEPNPTASFFGSLTPVGDQDIVSFTIPAVASVQIETFSGTTTTTCDDDTVIELRGPSCSTIIAMDDDDGLTPCSLIDPAVDTAARNLAPGTYYVRIEEYSNDEAISAYNVLITLTSLCGNNDVEPYEACDDGNLASGDGCSTSCVVEAGYTCMGDPSVCTAAGCGNGLVEGAEECDDGDMLGGDGCAAMCTVEADYQCTVSGPSVCSLAETNCSDGVDNDGDSSTDLADTDCAFGGAIAACGAGETLYVYNSVNVPGDVLDFLTTESPITATHGGVIARAAVRLSITHTYDNDVDISLVSPGGTTRDLSSDNGGSGMNYTATIFDNACATAITSGTAPFTGCFAPEQTLTALNGQDPSGVWMLNVYDDLDGDEGTLLSWSLALCVTP